MLPSGDQSERWMWQEDPGSEAWGLAMNVAVMPFRAAIARIACLAMNAVSAARSASS